MEGRARDVSGLPARRRLGALWKGVGFWFSASLVTSPKKTKTNFDPRPRLTRLPYSTGASVRDNRIFKFASNNYSITD
jgi:hypothetical protein